MIAYPLRRWQTAHPSRLELPIMEPAHQHGAGSVGMMRHGIGIWIDFCGSTPATTGAIEVMFAGGVQVLFAGGVEVQFA